MPTETATKCRNTVYYRFYYKHTVYLVITGLNIFDGKDRVNTQLRSFYPPHRWHRYSDVIPKCGYYFVCLCSLKTLLEVYTFLLCMKCMKSFRFSNRTTKCLDQMLAVLCYCLELQFVHKDARWTLFKWCSWLRSSQMSSGNQTKEKHIIPALSTNLCLYMYSGCTSILLFSCCLFLYIAVHLLLSSRMPQCISGTTTLVSIQTQFF